MEVMLEDIRVFKRYGVRGIVAGLLTADGRVDIERTKMFVVATKDRISADIFPGS